MTYNFENLTETRKKKLNHHLVEIFMKLEVYELLDVYNNFVYEARRDNGTSYDQILPNEVEYIHDRFEDECIANVLSMIHKKSAHSYGCEDDYFTVADGALLSLSEEEVKPFLRDHHLLPTIAKYLIENGTDFGVEDIAKVMEEYSMKSNTNL